MANSGILVISPSGNLYGSENVLLEYLKFTRCKFRIAVPAQSVLSNTLKEQFNSFEVVHFKNANLWKFYLVVAFQLLTGRLHTIYCNEGGHVKYLIWLSRIFKKCRFIIHIRILEDTSRERWIQKPGKNLITLVISEWLKEKLPYTSELVYDPFSFEIDGMVRHTSEEYLRIGVIGRITFSKGLKRLLELAEFLTKTGQQAKFRFLLFGDISEDVRNTGFVEKINAFSNIQCMGFMTRDEIYSNIHAVFHFSTQEALGRIVFEALDHSMPFAGMKAAGIGELGSILGMEDLLADPERGPEDILRVLNDLHEHYNMISSKMVKIKDKARKIFDPLHYAETIDKVLVP